MKLDSIVYDYSSLQTAIANTLNNESPSFKAIYPSDTATSLVNVLASYGSMLQYQLVSAMANAYTNSAYSEAGIKQLAETLGNRLHGNISSELYCTIERTTLRGLNNVIIPEGSTFTIKGLRFFNAEAITFTKDTNAVNNIKLIQGELKTAEFIASGESGEKFFFCEGFKCNTNRVRVFVRGEEWDIVDTFLPYVITDESVKAKAEVVVLKTDPDGRSYIKFGNNTNGRIPDINSIVSVEYISNEGANGNISSIDAEIVLDTPIFYPVDGINTKLEVNITATSTASGGFNTQSIDILRESSPYVYGSGQRAIRRNDYKAMLLNNCGYLTCNIWGEYEEAKLNGGYDKIMMNMVYYTGIKSIQKYDYQHISTPELSLNELNIANSEGEYPKFYNISNNIKSARGFLGSYIINIRSYDKYNNQIEVKYRDEQGTGILTCDPSINQNLPLKASSSTNFSDDFEQQIFPCNDLIDNVYSITTNQNSEFSDPVLEAQYDPNLLITGGYTKSSGVDENNQSFLITFDNPFQIRFQLKEQKSLTALAFKTPEKTLDNFIYQFGVYGTNEDPNTITYNNVKNNTKWNKLTGIQFFSNNLQTDSYTDWVTTNVYDPGSAETLEETFGIESLRLYNNAYVLKINELTLNKGFDYSLKINGITQQKSTYVIETITLDGETMDVLRFTSLDVELVDVLDSIVLYGTTMDWLKYKFYVIEIYSIQSSTQKFPSSVALQQIKAIFKESSSTITYINNNAVNLNIPIVYNSSTAQKQFGLPESFLFYEYIISINNVTEDNGYKTGDVLTCTIPVEGQTYSFKVTIVNLGGNLFKTTLDTNETGEETTILNGKGYLYQADTPLIGTTPEVTGQGGTLTISSKSIVTVYGSYTGNYYGNTDIQAIDSPIINKYNHFTTYVEFKQPHIKNVSIELEVEYTNVSNYRETKNNITTAINNLFEIKPYSIGSSLNVSDIWKTVGAIEGVSRFNVISPKNNIDCLPYELITLPAENLIINDIINSEYK